MKTKKFIPFLVIAAIIFSVNTLNAQPPGPGGPGGGGGGGGSAPVDSGTEWFLLAAAFYGRKILQSGETSSFNII